MSGGLLSETGFGDLGGWQKFNMIFLVLPGLFRPPVRSLFTWGDASHLPLVDKVLLYTDSYCWSGLALSVGPPDHDLRDLQFCSFSCVFHIYPVRGKKPSYSLFSYSKCDNGYFPNSALHSA